MDIFLNAGQLEGPQAGVCGIVHPLVFLRRPCLASASRLLPPPLPPRLRPLSPSSTTSDSSLCVSFFSASLLLLAGTPLVPTPGSQQRDSNWLLLLVRACHPAFLPSGQASSGGKMYDGQRVDQAARGRCDVKVPKGPFTDVAGMAFASCRKSRAGRVPGLCGPWRVPCSQLLSEAKNIFLQKSMGRLPIWKVLVCSTQGGVGGVRFTVLKG